MGFNQTYKLLHRKGYHKQNEKTECEKIFVNDVMDKDLISKVYKYTSSSYNSTTAKTHMTQPKNGQKT